MAEQVKIRLTIQEFIERYEEQPFEFINGEIREMFPVKFGHSQVAKRIYDALSIYMNQTKRGVVYFETVFITEDKSDWVKSSLVPDVSYYEQSRIDQYMIDTPNFAEKPLILVPDLAVEVVSPRDSYSEVSEKIETYIDYGVRLLWIVDPQRKTVTVYEGSTTSQTLHLADTVSGSSVLPGFKMSVKDIFVG
jgi:Uma2 family endonuclease